MSVTTVVKTEITPPATTSWKSRVSSILRGILAESRGGVNAIRHYSPCQMPSQSAILFGARRAIWAQSDRGACLRLFSYCTHRSSYHLRGAVSVVLARSKAERRHNHFAGYSFNVDAGCPLAAARRRTVSPRPSHDAGPGPSACQRAYGN